MRIIFFLLFLTGISLPTSAQMFSVGGEADSENRPASNNFIRTGYKPVEFIFKGDATILPNRDKLSFNSAAFSIGFDSPAVNGSLSIINRLTGSDDESYINLSLNYTNRFTFINKEHIKIGVPVNISTSLVNVAKTESNNDFSQTVFGLGTGLYVGLNLGSKVSIFLEGVPAYGFSNSNGGIFGGSNKSLEAKSRLNFLELISGRTLSLGYDFKLSSYDIDGESFDYDLNYQSITIGISL